MSPGGLIGKDIYGYLLVHGSSHLPLRNDRTAQY